MRLESNSSSRVQSVNVAKACPTGSSVTCAARAASCLEPGFGVWSWESVSSSVILTHRKVQSVTETQSVVAWRRRVHKDRTWASYSRQSRTGKASGDVLSPSRHPV